MLTRLKSRIGEVLPWQRGHRGQFTRNFLMQIYFTFVQSLIMVAVLGLVTGLALAFQTQFGLALLGSHLQLGKIFVFLIFRELTPLVAGMLLIARSVTAVAAEIATAKFQQETEALNVMGISLYHYLFAPRIVGGMMSLFCMAATFWAFALLGGYIGANLDSYHPPDQFLTSIANGLRPGDFLFFLLKTMLVGGVVSHIGIKRGLSLVAAPFEIPIVTNKAVVDALTVALGMHFALTFAYYVIYGLDL